MPLDDFFAKKEKKKKRKTNPSLLIEKLTKEVAKSKISDKDTGNDPTKNNAPENDEWENLDDEDDLDLQNIDVIKLSFNRADETSTSSVTEKEKDNSSEGDQVKVVWGGKRNTDEEAKGEAPSVPPPPEPAAEAPVSSGRYIPVHLRNKAVTAAKPNVANTSDFPTLDAAVSEPTPSKDRVQETATLRSAASAAEDASWSQAGTPRRLLPPHAAAADTLPLAVVNPEQHTPCPSAYVPPFMRTGRQETPLGDGGRQPSNGSAYPSERNRSRDPHYGGGGWQKYEGFTMRQPSEATGAAASGGGWSRGQVISTSATNSVDRQSRGTNSAFRPTSRPTSDWSSNVTVKTFRETNRDKTEFEVTQSNRFAGFNAT